MSLLTHFMGYIMVGSFKGRGNQYTVVCQDSVLQTVWASESNYQLSHTGYEV